MIVCDGHLHLNPGFADDVRRAADAENAARYSLLSLAQLRDDPAQNTETLLAKALDPARCFAFCSLDYERNGQPAPDPLEQVRLWLDAGFDGVKFIETKPNCQRRLGVRLDDMRFDPMFAYLEERGVPILWHNGDPAPFWDADKCPKVAIERGWAYLDPSYLSLDALYGIVETVLERHPKLRVTFAHFYFVSDDPAHAERMMTRYPNVHFDITPGTEMYPAFSENAGFFRDFITRYADRIQYGTDTGCDASNTVFNASMRDNIMRFLATNEEAVIHGTPARGIALAEDTVEQIMSRTHDGFVGLVPKPIDRATARIACEAAIERCSPDQKPFAQRAMERICAL